MLRHLKRIIVAGFGLFTLLCQATSNDYPTPLIDKEANPKGISVPNSFLGLHLNRWNDDTALGLGDLPMPGEITKKNGIAYFTSKNGHTFYYYRKGGKVKLKGMGAGGKDFETTITALETPIGQHPTVAKLADVPPNVGNAVIKSPAYVPSFGYGAVRSHSSGVNWATLHTAKGKFNAKLMSAWVARHASKKLMFTMTGTPEWLAASNIKSISRQVTGNLVTIQHDALDAAIPAGSKIKIRNCANAELNGEWQISASNPTSISYIVKASINENTTQDAETELLLWSNDGGYGYMNPPKDFSQANAFVTWLMKNYGNQITWIEGPNEANSGRNPQGKVWYSQGQGLWWAGSFDDLGEMMRRINTTAKAIKPSVLIGAPSITGLHHQQPINQSPSNRANGYQLLSAGDGAGGKLIDWVDFVPFHVYDIGAAWQLSEDKRTLYDTLPYLKQMLASPGVNKPNMPIYMNEGGFEHYAGYSSQAKKYFDSLPPKQQANEVFKIAAIYAGYGVKGFYPFASGFLGDYETSPEIAAAYDKINKRIAGNTIHPASGFNRQTGAMYFKTTDGYEEYIP